MMQERGIRENPMSHAEIGRKVMSLASTVLASLQAVMILAAWQPVGLRASISENRPQRGQFLPDLQAHSFCTAMKDATRAALREYVTKESI